MAHPVVKRCAYRNQKSAGRLKPLIVSFVFMAASSFCFAEDNAETRVQKMLDVFASEFKSLGIQSKVDYDQVRKFDIKAEVSRFPRSPNIARFYVTSEFMETPELTDDARTLQVCHEIGHLLGGTPIQPGDQSIIPTLSVEGEADYFATSYCLRRVWQDISKVRIRAPSGSKWCAQKYSDPEAHVFCNRVVDAAVSLSLFNFNHSTLEQDAQKGGYISGKDKRRFCRTPSVSRYEKRIVNTVQVNYPSPQCRLDTLIAGALCDNAVLRIVDGKIQFTPCDVTKESALSNLAKIQNGARPGCWLP